MSSVLSLLMEVQAFRDEINKKVLGLFEGFAGEKFRNLMMWALKEVGLEAYADASKCAPEQRAGGKGGLGLISGPFTGGASTDAEIRKELRAWEKANEAQLIRETRDGFGNQGLPLTTEQMKELLEFLQKSGWGPDEIEKHFENAKGEGESLAFAELMQRLRQVKGEESAAEGEAAGEPKEEAKKSEESIEKEGVKGEGGEETGDEASGGKVPVLDAKTSGEGLTGGSPAEDISVSVYARPGHFQHHKFGVWVFVKRRSTGQVVLKLKNVPVRVEHRFWYPNRGDEKTATHMEVHYKLLRHVDLSPHLNVVLTGGDDGIIRGYIKLSS